MCGIYAALSRTDQPPRPTKVLETRLRKRGPDHIGTTTAFAAPQHPGEAGLHLHFVSTVLSLRGSTVTAQPFTAPSTCSSSADAVLCWNGEAWRINGEPVRGNDGATIFAALEAASRSGTPDDVLLVLRSIEGPFAFVYFDSDARLLYFGRDRLGRRSLLVRYDANDTVMLSSTSDDDEAHPWLEVEADGIYVLSFGMFSAGAGYESCLSRHGWLPCCADEDDDDNDNDSDSDSDNDVVSTRKEHHQCWNGARSYRSVLGLGMFNMDLSVDGAASPLALGSQSEPVQTLGRLLRDAVASRVSHVPSRGGDADETRIAVLFSGGLDCTILARLASEFLPIDQGIDLINVAFENPRLMSRANEAVSAVDMFEACPDRITGRASLKELQTTCPGRAWRFIAVLLVLTFSTQHLHVELR